MNRGARSIAERLRRAAIATAVLLAVLFLLLLLEASGGHDGWLCEWGIDTGGPTTSGCG